MPPSQNHTSHGLGQQPATSSSAPHATTGRPEESRRRPPPHAPHERHDPHIRRRRKRRVRHKLFWRRYGLWGGLLLGLGGLGAFVAGLWVTALLLRPSPQDIASEQQRDFATVVQRTCEDTMLRVDCKCFWERSKDVYTEENFLALMTALTEREQWGPAITRGRMEKVAGPAATRVIGRALYDCVQM